MNELSTNEKQKILRREFKEFNKHNGFHFITPRIILREQNNILQYVAFVVKQGSLYGDIVAQPLYMEAEHFCLTIGIRINFLGEHFRHPWGHYSPNEKEFTKDVDEIIRILQDGGLKWFERSSNPKALIQMSLDENFKLTQGYSPLERLKTIARSYLFLGDIENGITYSEMYINEEKKYVIEMANPITTEYANKRILETQKWIDLAKSTPENLPQAFQDVISKTRSSLKLNR